MLWKRNNIKICEFWDCRKEVHDSDFLCSEHRIQSEKGLLDKCPRCGRYKDAIYYMCLDCYVGRKIRKKKLLPGRPMPGNEERIQSSVLKGSSSESDNYFVYILEVGSGVLYTGVTDNIRGRLTEVRNAKKSPETGKPPGLYYIEKARGEKSARTRVVELQDIVKSNPERIKAVSAVFHKNIKEFVID